MPKRDHINEFLNETVVWGFLPMTRGCLRICMDRAGYEKTGFGSGDFWACGRAAIDAEPLPDDIASAAFEALENGDPNLAFAIAQNAFQAAA